MNDLDKMDKKENSINLPFSKTLPISFDGSGVEAFLKDQAYKTNFTAHIGEMVAQMAEELFLKKGCVKTSFLITLKETKE